MSDKVSLWQAVKDNWGQLTAIAAGLVIAHLFVMSVMVDRSVASALASQDIATDAKIISMDDEIDANGAVGRANKENIEDNERRVEQAFAVLLGRDPDAN